MAGNRSAGNQRLQPFVSGGEYAGVTIGYRLTNEAIWPAQLHDCKAAIRWIRGNAKKYNLDPNRIGVMGDSAGGHLAAMLGTSGDQKGLEGSLGNYNKFNSVVQCVVDCFGPSDLLAMKDYPSRLNHDSPDSPEGKLVGGRVSQKEKIAKSASPITHVSENDPPFMIVHGNRDNIVPFNQSVRLAKSLRKSRVDCYFIVVQDGGHGRFRNREIMERQRQFFDKYLRKQELNISKAAIPNHAN